MGDVGKPPSPEYILKYHHIHGGDLHLIVGTFPFCVHSHFLFRGSAFWESLLKSFMEDEKALGHREEMPITLEDDISPQDFTNLLWVFYNERYGIYEADLEKWLSILSLASKWQFTQVQRFAIDHLKHVEMDLITRIKFYTDHHVPQAYIAPYYKQLAGRLKLFTPEQFCMLPPDTKYRMVRVCGILHQQSHIYFRVIWGFGVCVFWVFAVLLRTFWGFG